MYLLKIPIFLQTGGSDLAELIVVAFGPTLVIGFTLYLLWSGRRKNKKIMDKTRELLMNAFEEEFDDLIFDQLSSNGALLYPKMKNNAKFDFKNFRIVFALEERHLMLSVIISWFSGTSDYLAIEADPKGKKFTEKIQIIPRHEEGHINKFSELLLTLEDIDFGVRTIDETFDVRASSKRLGYELLADKELLKILYAMKDYLVRVSVDPSDDPPYRIYVRIKEGLDISMVKDLFTTIGKRIERFSTKTRGYTKK